MNYLIQTQQTGPHDDLIELVEKHAATVFQRPVSEKQQAVFSQLNTAVQEKNKPIILDSGCGTGDSSAHFAEQYPNHLIVALDRSDKRLAMAEQKHQYDNLIFARVNLEDAWRLMLEANWQIEKHFILYPNPYPKIGDLKKRFHGHAVFPGLLHLSSHIELRSNWRIYLEEFLLASQQISAFEGEVQIYEPAAPVTAFERKYQAVGETLNSLVLSRMERSVMRENIP